MTVPARVGHDEAEFSGVAAEPAEGGGTRETVFDRNVGGIADVDGTAGVVLAETRGGDEAEDVGERATMGEVATDDAMLARDAAEAREGDQRDAIGGSGGVHALPSGGGAAGETDRFFVGGMAADENQRTDRSFAERE